MPIILSLAIFSQDYIIAIVRSEYSEAAIYLTLSTLVYFSLPFGGYITHSLLNGIGETKITLFFNLLTLILFIIFGRYAIEKLSIYGIIILSSILYIITLILGLIYLKEKYGVYLRYKWSIRFYLTIIMTYIVLLFFDKCINAIMENIFLKLIVKEIVLFFFLYTSTSI